LVTTVVACDCHGPSARMDVNSASVSSIVVEPGFEW
jgi:hypothetical protein